MKAIVINVNQMTKMTWGKSRVRKLLDKTSVRWFNRYLALLWDEERMESDLGSDYITEELLKEVKMELRRMEHHLVLDKIEKPEGGPRTFSKTPSSRRCRNLLPASVGFLVRTRLAAEITLH